MPYELKVEGMAEISEALGKLADGAAGAAALGLYEGAGVMADEVNQSAAGIRTEEFHYAVFPGATTRLPSPEEKEIVMQAAVGIARFKKDGTEVDTSIGFRNAGYAQLKGRTVPIPVIVNAINSGTSFMKKQPFIRNAASKGAPKAMKAMKDKIESVLDEYLKAMSKI